MKAIVLEVDESINGVLLELIPEDEKEKVVVDHMIDALSRGDLEHWDPENRPENEFQIFINKHGS